MEDVDVPPRYERSWVHLKKSVCTLLLLRPRLGQNIGAKDAEIEVKGVQGQSGGRPSQSTRKNFSYLRIPRIKIAVQLSPLYEVIVDIPKL